MENIIIEKYPTPLKPRGYDWMAYLGGDDADGIYGFGATGQEAVADLMKARAGDE